MGVYLVLKQVGGKESVNSSEEIDKALSENFVSDFHLDKLYWDIALILTNDIDQFDRKGLRYKTIYGNPLNNIPCSIGDCIGWLSREELPKVIEWFESNHLLTIEGYNSYYSGLDESTKEEIELITDLSTEEQFGLICDLYNFYQDCKKNKTWILYCIT